HQDGRHPFSTFVRHQTGRLGQVRTGDVVRSGGAGEFARGRLVEIEHSTWRRDDVVIGPSVGVEGPSVDVLIGEPFGAVLRPGRPGWSGRSLKDSRAHRANDDARIVVIVVDRVGRTDVDEACTVVDERGPRVGTPANSLGRRSFG